MKRYDAKRRMRTKIEEITNSISDAVEELAIGF
jgi:hypothetical protein